MPIDVTTLGTYVRLLAEPRPARLAEPAPAAPPSSGLSAMVRASWPTSELRSLASGETQAFSPSPATPPLWVPSPPVPGMPVFMPLPATSEPARAVGNTLARGGASYALTLQRLVGMFPVMFDVSLSPQERRYRTYETFFGREP